MVKESHHQLKSLKLSFSASLFLFKHELFFAHALWTLYILFIFSPFNLFRFLIAEVHVSCCYLIFIFATHLLSTQFRVRVDATLFDILLCFSNTSNRITIVVQSCTIKRQKHTHKKSVKDKQLYSMKKKSFCLWPKYRHSLKYIDSI